ncbi:MAG: hypothetical protein KA118_19560 [Verrucomicrobia bacterium]|nr:hypothetical protein [Verrucomicrobiota bacterium]
MHRPYARAGQWSDAARCAERAMALAVAARNEEFAREIQERLEQCRRRP